MSLPEDLLRKYRPVGPPSGLRARILVPERATWPWALAAAALLFLTIALHAATRSLGAADPPTPAFGPDARIAFIAHALGDGEEARRTATFIVMEEERRSALPPVAAATLPSEGAR